MTYIDIVFSGPPSEPATFVEVENPAGQSISVGEWLQRPDGYWVLRIPSPVVSTSESTYIDALIAEARRNRVLWDAPDFVRRLADALESTTADLARAREVIEKAHAPTDDEREALIAELDKATDYYGRAHDGFGPVADAILTAGFRRSEVPEPQGEPSDALRAVNDLALAAHGANSRRDDADFLRGHINHAVPIVRAALRADGAAFDVFEKAHAPTDAKVLAVAQALCTAENAGDASWDMLADQHDWYFSQARAALRAADVVGQTKSTPVDHEH